MQIADGFLRSHTISRTLVVASDADPGRGASERFPFSPVGAALLCKWSDQDDGLGLVYRVNNPDDGENFRAPIDFDKSCNVLRFRESAAIDIELAAACAQAAQRCLEEAALDASDVPVIIATPPHHQYRAELAARLGDRLNGLPWLPTERIHTASLSSSAGT